MRFSARFFVKVASVVVLFLVMGPLLLSQLDSYSSKSDASYQQHIKRVQHLFNSEAAGLLNKDAQKGPLAIAPAGLAEPRGRLAQTDTDGRPGMGRRRPTAEYRDGMLGNFEPPQPAAGSSPGEGGAPVYPSMEEQAAAAESSRMYGFNMVVSDKIAMNRTIPDTRLPECKYWHYWEDLPSASVILVFHNEGFSSLIRTVHSVVNTSPKRLLKEVVMVDDFSDKENLKSQLEQYLQTHFGDLVKLYRNSKREGLIRTRTLGASYATGDVIVFLDAHCECNRNWLVPLLARIGYDRTIMAVPTIDGIDWNTFRYSPVYGHSQHYRGIFEWGFLYKESQVPERELASRKHNSEPYKSPTHAGGLFAMDRKYFFELGAYDPGLLIWGGENFELSFKIWQCGGSIEWVPCSRVGHVYRNHMPYGFGDLDAKIPVININYMRVVEVWLDEQFREYFYTREPSIRGYPVGNLTAQLAFKREHNCKSFQWFMTNVAYEVYDRFPPPPPNRNWGEIRERNGGLCWDAAGHSVGASVLLHGCHHWGGSQLFRLNVEGQLASGERCIEFLGGELKVQVCPVSTSGPWSFDAESGLIKHSRSELCAESTAGQLVLRTCNRSEPKQQWAIKETRTWDR